jgi:hypothetical protein
MTCCTRRFVTLNPTGKTIQLNHNQAQTDDHIKHAHTNDTQES